MLSEHIHSRRVVMGKLKVVPLCNMLTEKFHGVYQVAIYDQWFFLSCRVELIKFLVYISIWSICPHAFVVSISGCLVKFHGYSGLIIKTLMRELLLAFLRT